MFTDSRLRVRNRQLRPLVLHGGKLNNSVVTELRGVSGVRGGGATKLHFNWDLIAVSHHVGVIAAQLHHPETEFLKKGVLTQQNNHQVVFAQPLTNL